MLNKLILIIGVAGLFSANVSAAGDVEAGKAKSATCAACHGVDGISSLAANPNLAAQVPGYISAQLKAFKSGERNNAIMMPLTAGLSDQDMADLDAYYASLPASTEVKLTEEETVLAVAGEKIYRGGYAPREVSACIACHGPAGKGVPKNYPRVSAQHKAYLEKSLLDYKKGDRTGYNGIMHSIAFGLSEEQIKALSAYMAGLNAPATAE